LCEKNSENKSAKEKTKNTLLTVGIA